MNRYFKLQLKRAFKIFPYVIIVSLVLFIGAAAVLGGILSGNRDKEENTMVNIGVTGDTENSLLQLGLGAFKAIDDTKYSVELIEYKESDAGEALKKGEIAAYIVIPEEFVEKAFRGEVEVIRFVTTAETNDVVTMFKNEVLEVITRMVIACQKGTYGIGDALDAGGHADVSGQVQNEISMDYFELVMSRNTLIEVEELGIGSSLSATNYYFCSVLLLFLTLMGLPYAALYCKSDNSLSALLCSKGTGSFKVLVAEYLAHLLSLSLLGAVALGGTFAADKVFGAGLFGDTFGCPFGHIFPVLVMLAAFNLMIFELASNIISALLGHFFINISLCYISGCFFPLYSFPEAVQSIASVLPIGISRQLFSALFTGESLPLLTLAVLGYAVLFFSATLLAKRIKLQSRKGGIV